MTKTIIFTGLLFLLASCGKNCEPEIASDQLKFADSIEQNNKTYYLYTLTTGWNDKAVYFQLYDEEPILNECEKTGVKPIFEIVYDDYPKTKYVKEIVLQGNPPESFKVIYTPNKNQGIEDIYKVKFARRSDLMKNSL